MIGKLGEQVTQLFRKYMPDAFVFAILLTLLVAFGALFWVGVSPLEIIVSWYDGFFDLLAFGMQIVLIIITGFAIALSPAVNKGIDYLTRFIRTPRQVYFFVVMIGMLLSLVSFGWLVITAVLARELALRIKGINYAFLIACVYFSMNSWVMGLSSSIPLLLNTDKNFLIDAGILETVIPTSYTLGAWLNITMILLLVLGAPIIMLLLLPKHQKPKELCELLAESSDETTMSIQEEASLIELPKKAVSDRLNNSVILQAMIVLMGVTYIVYHFMTKGLDLNFNIMIFFFLILGLLLHKTPIRYVVAMKRASSNISGVLFQYPFYAGIMGIMLYTGLGERLAQLLASVATIDSYPFYAYLTGGMVNFAIPSAGGEFAVVGPGIIEAVKEIGAGLPEKQVTAMISRASLSIAYGESLSNMLQPFYLLLVIPIMAKGVNIHPRDVMGYLLIPFLLFFVIQSLLVVFMPLA
ncbi:short-chain fatty acid transporter [Flavobacteriaceae bacterium TP-CH-4]|uniref:Short-chain fatty acid transporter n=1 Tax=Pelagihabitans pacificus TaxID=2696054 RepID=A0A967ASH7_9FLAO|nr:TIGR00366 family protein [Pelagihabitans pacificus]NHF59468.1 short-chain fatty acid transporter [Pelagihabitans pacificus]